ncbi:TetR/AcrR family transcriptional regulator [Babesia caballi]|uniref:TetR/AcrR family transcriptional regulator n=1 Tax=Babesia caballi TaxID=5871 RepID=A0AAV4LZQ0_BABCB|nr:TetR/AcrR family transcriptional regulator [Babesia caballi]
MELQITGPFNRLSTEDLEIIDDVVQSFCDAVDVVLKTNFKSQKRDASHLDSATRSTTGRAEGVTKNQKIAAVFCRQWLAGVVSELTHKLAEDTSARFHDEAAPKMLSPRILEEGADEAAPDDIGVCVENARICGSGQIEVNYDLDPSEVPQHLKPKLKAQELAQLILQGKQTEQDLMQKLERFWRDAPSHLCDYLQHDEEGAADGEGQCDKADGGTQHSSARDEPEGGSAAQDASAEPVLPLDDQAIQVLEAIASGASDGRAPESGADETIQERLAHLAEKAEELGVQGMDTYIALYNRVNKEITNINRMAKFFSKLATDLAEAQD